MQNSGDSGVDFKVAKKKTLCYDYRNYPRRKRSKKMTTFEMIIGAVLVAVLVGIAYVAYKFLSMLLPWVNKVFEFVTWPFRKLWELLSELVEGFLPVGWTCGAEIFGGVGSLVVFLASLAFVAVVCIVAAIRGNFSDTIEPMFFNTTMGTFYALFSDGLSISPATVAAVGFSGCLASTCMKSAEDIPWFIWIPYCIVFVAMSAFLVTFLTPVLETVGTWGWESLRGLWEDQATGFFGKLGRIIALLFLGYLAVVCLVMVVREYFACFCFGPITLAGIIAVMLILQFVFGAENGAQQPAWLDAMVVVLFFGSMLFVEFMRERVEGDII